MKRLALLAAVVLGVCVVSAYARPHAGAAPSNLTPGQASVTIDKLLAAETAHDVDAMTAMYARSGFMWQNGTTYSGTAQMRKHNQQTGPNGYRVKRVSPVIVNGNLATVYERAWVSGGLTWLGLGVYQLQGGHVSASWEFIVHGGPGSTPPFDKGQW